MCPVLGVSLDYRPRGPFSQPGTGRKRSCGDLGGPVLISMYVERWDEGRTTWNVMSLVRVCGTMEGTAGGDYQ